MKIIDLIAYEIKKIKERKSLAKYILLVITLIGALTNNLLVLLLTSSTAVYVLFHESMNEVKFLQWRNQKYYPGKKAQERKLLKWMTKKHKENVP